MTWYAKGFSLDINTTILIFLLVGLALQGTPIAYADAIRGAARQTGSMLLQYPIYGGIMGIMTGTGLPPSSRRVRRHRNAADAAGLELLQFADHHVPRAERRRTLGRAGAVRAAGGAGAARFVPRTAMGVAMAENVPNMLQPFWAVPWWRWPASGIQRVMGYTAITFVVSLVIYAAALWLIP